MKKLRLNDLFETIGGDRTVLTLFNLIPPRYGAHPIDRRHHTHATLLMVTNKDKIKIYIVTFYPSEWQTIINCSLINNGQKNQGFD